MLHLRRLHGCYFYTYSSSISRLSTVNFQNEIKKFNLGLLYVEYAYNSFSSEKNSKKVVLMEKRTKKIQKINKRLLFRRWRVLSRSVTDAKLMFQLLHVYAIHKCLNICRQVYTLKDMAERAAEKGRIRGAQLY